MKKFLLVVAMLLVTVAALPAGVFALAQEDSPYTLEIDSAGVSVPFPDLDADWVYRVKILKDEQIVAENVQSFAFGFGDYVIEYHAENLVTDERTVLTKNVRIVDTTAPVLQPVTNFRKSYTTGTGINLGCTVTDNSGENITAEVNVEKDEEDISSQIKDGYIELLSAGKYTVIFRAEDSSGNAAAALSYEFEVTGDDISGGGLQWYWYLIIGVAAALIALVVVFAVIRRKKGEKK